MTIMDWLDMHAAALFHAQPKSPSVGQYICYHDQPEAIKNVWRWRYLRGRR